MEQKGQQMNLIASLICFMDINIIKIVGKFILFSPQDKLVGCYRTQARSCFLRLLRNKSHGTPEWMLRSWVL